jgi:catechol 2,3-dioxygenase-like lactoylglutathione lyase family enzyme
LNGTDYVEFYVGNARQAAHYYRAAFGMQLAAYMGPETGNRESASYLVQQGKIRFVLTTPLHWSNPIAEHIRIHGDGVKDIALGVDDAESAFAETMRRGAKAVLEPIVLRDDHGEVKKSAIAAYGDTIHTFVERKNYKGAVICSFVPRPLEQAPGAQKVPFYHRNTDYDEFIFYHDGDFFSRDNIYPGMVTLHPRGIHHGPHPKAFETQDSKTRTDEYAVMLDTRDTLRILPEGEAVERHDYWMSWQDK